MIFHHFMQFKILQIVSETTVSGKGFKAMAGMTKTCK